MEFESFHTFIRKKYLNVKYKLLQNNINKKGGAPPIKVALRKHPAQPTLPDIEVRLLNMLRKLEDMSADDRSISENFSKYNFENINKIITELNEKITKIKDEKIINDQGVYTDEPIINNASDIQKKLEKLSEKITKEITNIKNNTLSVDREISIPGFLPTIGKISESTQQLIKNMNIHLVKHMDNIKKITEVNMTDNIKNIISIWDSIIILIDKLKYVEHANRMLDNASRSIIEDFTKMDLNDTNIFHQYNYYENMNGFYKIYNNQLYTNTIDAMKTSGKQFALIYNDKFQINDSDINDIYPSSFFIPGDDFISEKMNINPFYTNISSTNLTTHQVISIDERNVNPLQDTTILTQSGDLATSLNVSNLIKPIFKNMSDTETYNKDHVDQLLNIFKEFSGGSNMLSNRLYKHIDGYSDDINNIYDNNDYILKYMYKVWKQINMIKLVINNNIQIIKDDIENIIIIKNNISNYFDNNIITNNFTLYYKIYVINIFDDLIEKLNHLIKDKIKKMNNMNSTMLIEKYDKQLIDLFRTEKLIYIDKYKLIKKLIDNYTKIYTDIKYIYTKYVENKNMFYRYLENYKNKLIININDDINDLVDNIPNYMFTELINSNISNILSDIINQDNINIDKIKDNVLLEDQFDESYIEEHINEYIQNVNPSSNEIIEYLIELNNNISFIKNINNHRNYIINKFQKYLKFKLIIMNYKSNIKSKNMLKILNWLDYDYYNFYLNKNIDYFNIIYENEVLTSYINDINFQLNNLISSGNILNCDSINQVNLNYMNKIKLMHIETNSYYRVHTMHRDYLNLLKYDEYNDNIIKIIETVKANYENNTLIQLGGEIKKHPLDITWDDLSWEAQERYESEEKYKEILKNNSTDKYPKDSDLSWYNFAIGIKITTDAKQNVDNRGNDTVTTLDDESKKNPSLSTPIKYSDRNDIYFILKNFKYKEDFDNLLNIKYFKNLTSTNIVPSDDLIKSIDSLYKNAKNRDTSYQTIYNDIISHIDTINIDILIDEYLFGKKMKKFGKVTMEIKNQRQPNPNSGPSLSPPLNETTAPPGSGVVATIQPLSGGANLDKLYKICSFKNSNDYTIPDISNIDNVLDKFKNGDEKNNHKLLEIIATEYESYIIFYDLHDNLLNLSKSHTENFSKSHTENLKDNMLILSDIFKDVSIIQSKYNMEYLYNSIKMDYLKKFNNNDRYQYSNVEYDRIRKELLDSFSYENATQEDKIKIEAKIDNYYNLFNPYNIDRGIIIYKIYNHIIKEFKYLIGTYQETFNDFEKLRKKFNTLYLQMFNYQTFVVEYVNVVLLREKYDIYTSISKGTVDYYHSIIKLLHDKCSNMNNDTTNPDKIIQVFYTEYYLILAKLRHFFDNVKKYWKPWCKHTNKSFRHKDYDKLDISSNGLLWEDQNDTTPTGLPVMPDGPSNYPSPLIANTSQLEIQNQQTPPQDAQNRQSGQQSTNVSNWGFPSLSNWGVPRLSGGSPTQIEDLILELDTINVRKKINESYYNIIDYDRDDFRKNKFSYKMEDGFFLFNIFKNILDEYEASMPNPVSVYLRINDKDKITNLTKENLEREPKDQYLNMLTTGMLNISTYMTFVKSNDNELNINYIQEKLYLLNSSLPEKHIKIKDIIKDIKFKNIFDPYGFSDNSVLALYIGLPNAISRGKSIVMMTYGYSGVGKTFSIFGGDNKQGLLQKTLTTIKNSEKIYFKCYEIYGIGLPYKSYWTRVDTNKKYNHEIHIFKNFIFNNESVTFNYDKNNDEKSGDQILNYIQDVNKNEYNLANNESDIIDNIGESSTNYQLLDIKELNKFNLIVKAIDDTRKNKLFTIKKTINNPESSRSIMIYEFKIKYSTLYKINDKYKKYVNFVIIDLPGKENLYDSYVNIKSNEHSNLNIKNDLYGINTNAKLDDLKMRLDENENNIGSPNYKSEIDIIREFKTDLTNPTDLTNLTDAEKKKLSNLEMKKLHLARMCTFINPAFLCIFKNVNHLIFEVIRENFESIKVLPEWNELQYGFYKIKLARRSSTNQRSDVQSLAEIVIMNNFNECIDNFQSIDDLNKKLIYILYEKPTVNYPPQQNGRWPPNNDIFPYKIPFNNVPNWPPPERWPKYGVYPNGDGWGIDGIQLYHIMTIEIFRFLIEIGNLDIIKKVLDKLINEQYSTIALEGVYINENIMGLMNLMSSIIKKRKCNICFKRKCTENDINLMPRSQTNDTISSKYYFKENYSSLEFPFILAGYKDYLNKLPDTTENDSKKDLLLQFFIIICANKLYKQLPNEELEKNSDFFYEPANNNNNIQATWINNNDDIVKLIVHYNYRLHYKNNNDSSRPFKFDYYEMFRNAYDFNSIFNETPPIKFILDPYLDVIINSEDTYTIDHFYLLFVVTNNCIPEIIDNVSISDIKIKKYFVNQMQLLADSQGFIKSIGDFNDLSTCPR